MRKLTIVLALQLIWLIAPAQEQWFSEADITGLDFPGAARRNAVSFVIGDTAYVGTGDNGTVTLTDFYKYVPATKTWTQIADFPGNKRSGAVAFVLDGKGYVGTGRSGNTLFDDFYRYNPATNVWDTVANFGGGDRRNAIAFVVDGKAYVGTGNTTDSFGSISDDLWEYDPNMDAWTPKASVPNPRTLAVAFSINNRGYVALGYGSSNYVNNICEYNPTTNTFVTTGLTAMEGAKQDGVAFAANNKAYIGLGDRNNNFIIYEPGKPVVFQTGSSFGLASEDNRWGAVVFTIRNKAFVGLGVYTPDVSAPLANVYKNDIWSFQSPTPDKPENLTATTPTQTSVTLQWTSHANNETGYEIERSEGNSESFAVEGVEGVDSTLYERNGLPVDKEYFYRVRARGTNQNSPYSDTVVVNTYNPPSDLIATVASATEITLNWQDNSSGEQGFIIQRSTSGTAYSALDTVLADVITFTDTTAQLGLDYTYRVLTQATKSASAASNTITAGSLTNPTDLTADAAGGAFVQLRWSYSGNNAARFVVERQDSEGGAFTLVANVVSSSSPSYQDKTVAEASSYTYRVKAENLPRTSTYSATASATTQLLDPTAVTATIQDNTVTLSWNDVSNLEAQYAVQRSLADGSNAATLATLAADASSFIDTTSLSAGDYRYTVQALGTAANSNLVASNTITVVEPPEETETPGEEEPDPEEEPTPEEEEEEEEEVVTGIDELSNLDEVKVYPNPSAGQAEVFVGDERFAYIAVFNSQGRLMDEVQQAEQGSSSNVQLDLQHLPVGVYTLRVYTSRGVFVRKIAKQ